MDFLGTEVSKGDLIVISWLEDDDVMETTKRIEYFGRVGSLGVTEDDRYYMLIDDGQATHLKVGIGGPMMREPKITIVMRSCPTTFTRGWTGITKQGEPFFACYGHVYFIKE